MSNHPSDADRRRREGEEGTALVLAVLFTIVVVGVVASGTMTLRSRIAYNRTLFITNYQAVMTARSGLTEAISWLRRQTSQPVTTFEPVLDTGVTPNVLDTDDPDIGLVREFKISGNLWARYEVWKEWAADPDPDRLAWRQQFACEDVSEPKTHGAPGAAWHIRSVGYIYRRLDPGVAFNVKPNVVLASELVETDALRAVINLPGQAAVNIRNGGDCNINSNGRVRGNGTAGVYYLSGTGSPGGGGSISGTPSSSAAASYDDSYEEVFGLSFSELTAMADQVVSNTADFPSPLPMDSMVIADVSSPLTITSSNPLTGSGLVIVRGDVDLQLGNNSLFSGLLFVDGDLTMRSPSEINGAVLCTGTLTLQGSSDYATINFDQDALDALMVQFGTYRQANTLFLPRRNR